MIQALIGPIANLAGSFMESKIEQTKAKGRVAQAKAEAEAEVMKVAATHEAGWEKIMAQSSDNSWKDEAWTILFIIIIAMCFVPFTQPYVEEGFALQVSLLTSFRSIVPPNRIIEYTKICFRIKEFLLVM